MKQMSSVMGCSSNLKLFKLLKLFFHLVPLQVRKRFHHTPRSSREQASTATHALDDDPATSRQERRRTQSRPNSRERKAHRTTTATAREEEMQRERRNVMQRLTGLFLWSQWVMLGQICRVLRDYVSNLQRWRWYLQSLDSKILGDIKEMIR